MRSNFFPILLSVAFPAFGGIVGYVANLTRVSEPQWIYPLLAVAFAAAAAVLLKTESLALRGILFLASSAYGIWVGMFVYILVTGA